MYHETLTCYNWIILRWPIFRNAARQYLEQNIVVGAEEERKRIPLLAAPIDRSVYSGFENVVCKIHSHP